MNPPPGWVETKQPWQLGNFQIGDKVYAPPAPAGGDTPGGAPGGAPVVSPGYSGGIPSYTMAKAIANINSGLSGELPQDVVDQIRTHAAEFGVGSGLSGSDFSGYNGLKNLGLTSLQRQDDATKSLMPFFQTPGGQAQGDQFNVNNITRANQITAAQAAAARDAAQTNWNATRRPNVMGGYGGGGGGTPAPIMGGSLSGVGGPPAHSVAHDIISRNLPGLGDLLGGYGGGGDPHGTGSYAPLQTGEGDDGGDDWFME